MNASGCQSRIRLGEERAAHHKAQDNLLEEKHLFQKYILEQKAFDRKEILSVLLILTKKRYLQSNPIQKREEMNRLQLPSSKWREAFFAGDSMT